jgi:hypothetical protein
MEQYLKNLTGVLALGAAFASIPFFASLSSLEPPWPPAIGYVSAALVLVGAMLAWEWTRSAKVKNRRRWIVSAVALTLGGLILYLTLYSLFVQNVPGATDRIIRGYECTRDTRLIYAGQCPELSRAALEDSGWEPSELWTTSSLTLVRLGLTLSWLIFTAGLIITVGSIVAGRGRTSTRRRPSNE